MLKNCMILLLMVHVGNARASEEGLFQTRYSHKVVKYVKRHLGKRVGDGVCGTLTEHIMKKTRTEMAFKFMLKKKNFPFIAVGDFIWFTGTSKVENPKHRYAPKQKWLREDHIAVVVGILNDNTLIIAHQNVGVDRLVDSRVVLSLLKGDDPKREELMAVMGLLPQKTGYTPEKLLSKKSHPAGINLSGKYRGYFKALEIGDKEQLETVEKSKF